MCQAIRPSWLRPNTKQVKVLQDPTRSSYQTPIPASPNPQLDKNTKKIHTCILRSTKLSSGS